MIQIHFSANIQIHKYNQVQICQYNYTKNPQVLVVSPPWPINSQSPQTKLIKVQECQETIWDFCGCQKRSLVLTRLLKYIQAPPKLAAIWRCCAPKLLNVWPFCWTHCASDRRLLRRVIGTRRYSVHSSSSELSTTSAGSIFGRAIVPHNYIWQNIRVHETLLGRAIVVGNYVYLAEHCIGRRCRLGGTSEVEVAAASHIWQLVEELPRAINRLVHLQHHHLNHLHNHHLQTITIIIINTNSSSSSSSPSAPMGGTPRKGGGWLILETQ